MKDSILEALNETEEKYRERVGRARKIVNRACISFENGGEITIPEIKGRLRELEGIGYSVCLNYEKMKSPELREYFERIKRNIKVADARPSYFDD